MRRIGEREAFQIFMIIELVLVNIIVWYAVFTK